MPRFSKSQLTRPNDGRLSKTLPADHVCEIMGGRSSPRKDKSKQTNFLQLNSPQSGRNQSLLRQVRKSGVKLKGSYASQQRKAIKAECRQSGDVVWNQRLGSMAGK